MHRGLVHVLAWSLATGAAATLSWWGVHTVMAGTAYDPPHALPITAAEATVKEPPSASAVRPPAAPPSATASASASSRTPPVPRPSASEPGTHTGPSPAATATGRVKSYDTDGGRVVFDLGPAAATLVSATPGTGWSMQVWKTAAWIRVEFTSGTARVSVICTWHDGPPRVDVGNY